MERHSAENVNTPDLNNSDFPPLNARTVNADRTPSGVDYKATQYVAVSNKLIGQVLASKAPKPKNPGSSEEASKSRVYAICELFRKGYWEKYFPNGFAANVTSQKNEHGVSNRQFRQAHMNLMRVNGHFGRRQGGYRHLADEDPLPPSDGGEVRMPIWTVAPPAKGCPDKRPSKKVFAFAVATLRKMKPCRPADIGKDLGFSDAQTCNKYAREAGRLRLIALHVGERGVLYVGRPGTDFSGLEHPKKNDPTKNDLKKNGPSHINCKEGTDLSSSSSGALGEEERKGKVVEGSRCRDVRAPLTSPVDKIILWNWRTPRSGEPLWYWHEFYSDEFQRPSEVELEAARLSRWRDTVERLGPVPGYLTSEWAYEQAVDISRELLFRLGHDVENPDVIRYWLPKAVRGLAGKVVGHLRDGGEIKNLNFLASRLLARCEQGDDSWMYSLPSRLSEDDSAWVRRYGERLAIYAKERGHRLNHREMTGTLQLERLHDLLISLGDGNRDAGYRILIAAIDRSPRPDKDYHWTGWGPFKDAAEAIHRQQLLDYAEDATGHVQLIAIARTCGHRIDETELSSPAGLQDLNDLLIRLGNSDREAGLRYLVRGIKKAAPLPEDKVVIKWSWFEEEAVAAFRRSLAAKRAAETRAYGRPRWNY